ncbi:MAG: DUF1476 domain-containing protein [Caulobacteraceae bacterium]
MTILDEREKAFERQFANEEEREFLAHAARNRMIGEWAAGLMGLDDVSGYAAAVVRSDLGKAGGADVLRKVSGDLSAAGMGVGAAEVSKRMEEFLAVARCQIRAGEGTV